MNKQAYDTMLAVLDDSIAIANEAVKAASEAEAEARQLQQQLSDGDISLVKVAAARCGDVADQLLDTGAFNGVDRPALVSELQKGPEAQLRIMEKMASRVAFSLDSEMDLGGDLVERSTPSQKELPDKTQMWRDAIDETRANNA